MIYSYKDICSHKLKSRLQAFLILIYRRRKKKGFVNITIICPRRFNRQPNLYLSKTR